MNLYITHILRARSAAVAAGGAVQGQTQETEGHGRRPPTGRHVQKLQTRVHAAAVLHLGHKQISLMEQIVSYVDYR